MYTETKPSPDGCLYSFVSSVSLSPLLPCCYHSNYKKRTNAFNAGQEKTGNMTTAGDQTQSHRGTREATWCHTGGPALAPHAIITTFEMGALFYSSLRICISNDWSYHSYEGTKCYGFYLIPESVNQQLFRSLHNRKLLEIQNLGLLRPSNFLTIQINASYSSGNPNHFFMGYALCSSRLLSFRSA